MIDEIDYTLKRLDEWYGKKFIEKYTLRLEEEMKRKMFEATGRDMELKNIINDAFSRENLIRNADFFSRDYCDIEDILRHNEVPNIAENLVDFVGRVRQKSCDVFPDELKDMDIDSAFRETFSSSDYFAKAFIGASEIQEPNLIEEYGEQTTEQQQKINLYFGSAKKIIPYLMEGVLGDLYKDG